MGGKTRDNIRFISKLSFRKIFNGLRVLSGYYLSRALHRPVAWGLPASISIEPTTHCNLRCPECPSGLRSFSRPTGTLQAEVFHKIIDECAKDVSYLLFYFQGEPYLHPDFISLVAYASSRGIYTATSTNAHFLDDEKAKDTVASGLDRLIISIDGTTQETYSAYRKGGLLEKVISGTKNIVHWKKAMSSPTPHIIFQFLVVKPNEGQVEEVKALGKELGVDEVRLKTAQIYDFEKGNPLMPENGNYSRYKKQSDGTYTIRNKLGNHCWKLWSSCVITWDGKVVPCCFDKDASHRVGDLTDTSLRKVWKEAPYQDFRRAVLRSRKEIDICQNCTEGLRVWA